ncbi:hypothetical protein MHYP_G00365590 [Metynnis hypsauchen]
MNPLSESQRPPPAPRHLLKSHSPLALPVRSEPTIWDLEARPKVSMSAKSLHLMVGHPRFLTDLQHPSFAKSWTAFRSFILALSPQRRTGRMPNSVRAMPCSSSFTCTTELHVEAPEEVTEGETADLTCNTTCSLTDPTFIWYKDGCPLTTKTIKNNQLHLQTVSSEDAGSYSCAVRGSQHLHSTAHSLGVRCRSSSAVWFAVGGGSFLLITVLICICSFHRMKKRAAGTDHSKTRQDDVLYTSVTASTSRPAQAADSADSGAADVLYMTVRVQNGEVTSTDQQGEYDNVTLHHHTAATV